MLQDFEVEVSKKRSRRNKKEDSFNAVDKMIFEILSGNRKEDIQYICDESGLDYRTVRELLRMIEADEDVFAYEVMECLFDKDFYTLKNVVPLYQNGFKGLIPTEFFMNKEFAKRVNLTTLPNNFVTGNTELKEFVILPCIKHIGDNAFKGCTKLILENIPDSVQYVGDSAFAECHNIRQVFLPRNISYLGRKAFYNCTSLLCVEKGTSIDMVSDSCFEGCYALRSIELNNRVSVGEKAFKGCVNLRDINSAVFGMEKESFKNCKSLRTIRINGTRIPKRAFSNCVSLESVVFLSEAPTVIEEDAFENCVAFKEIRVNDFMYNFIDVEGFDELYINEIDKTSLVDTITQVEIKPVRDIKRLEKIIKASEKPKSANKEKEKVKDEG